MIKKPVVAGSFYPNDAGKLRQMLDLFFKSAENRNIPPKKDDNLFAIIAPHAGYIYSGQTAANIYQQIRHFSYKNAVVVAPTHQSFEFPSLGGGRGREFAFFVGDYEAYETPLELLQTNREVVKKLLEKPGFAFDERIDIREHSLEVQLPFLQHLNPDVKLIPILFCRQNLENAIILSKYLQEILDKDTLLVISTDLSHFHNAKKAEQIDNALIELVKANDIENLYEGLKNRKYEACGFGGILTLIHILKSQDGAFLDDFDYTHSGVVSGDNGSVVGYFSCGAYGGVRSEG